MTFTLTGFDERGGFRRFVFRYMRADQTHAAVMVRADVSLARKHEIRLQELPLICVRLLDGVGADALAGPITLTEDHMIGIEQAARDAAAERALKQPPCRPANPDAGNGWSAARERPSP